MKDRFSVRGLEGIKELAEALTLGLGMDSVVEIALRNVIAMMDVDIGLIYLFEDDPPTAKRIAQQGLFTANLASVFQNLAYQAEPFRGLLEAGAAFALDDACASDQPVQPGLAEAICREGFASWACAPLKMEGEVIGVYHLCKRSRRAFTTEDKLILEIVGNIVGSSLSSVQLLKDLRYKEAELRRALRRAVELQEEERKRLVRELHDEVGQALTSILISLKTLQEAEDFDLVKKRLSDLRALTALTIEELRRLSMDLRPSALDNLGLVPALRWFVQQSAERSGLDITFLGPETYERLGPEAELTLYRIAQEGLTNAIRHGKARKIVVFLERDLDLAVVRLTITDDGAGFNVTASDRGLGLVGIRERVELLNGYFNIETTPGAGTQLWIEIPMKK